MALNYNSVDQIDDLVSKGLSLGYYSRSDDLSKLPTNIGDWLIHTVPDGYKPDVGLIVAVPSNKRTRLIYQDGRVRWLITIGYRADYAQQYVRASKGVSHSWDHRVATFVNDNFTLDSFIIDAILTSALPRKTCLEHGIFTTLNHGKVIAACTILKRLKPL